MPAGRRQHGRPTGGIRGGLLAWLGGEAPTWAADRRDSGRSVGVARRWDMALLAGRRQHGRPAGRLTGNKKRLAGGTPSSGKPTSLVLVSLFTKRYLAYSVKQNVSPSLCRSPAVSLLVFFYRAFFYKIIRCILRCTVHPDRCPRKCIRGRLPEHLRRCRCAVPGTACRPRCRTRCLPDPAA